MKSFVVYTRKYFLLPVLLCIASLIFPIILQAQFSVSTTTTLPGVLSAAVSWGDYDNDGDLDIVLTGQNSMTISMSHIYKNMGGGVFTTAATLVGVSSGAVSWGDYDNDGDLDILLTGLNNSSIPVSIVYRNDGGDTFTSVATLTGVYNSSVAWGDYDNDGDLDILIAGQTDATDGLSRIYRNNGDNTFTLVVSLAAVYNGAAAAWGDYDNDGRLDVVFAGQTGLLTGVARIYRNNGNNNFSAAVDLPNLSLGISQAAAVWGDYDNDGDLDLLVSGNNLLGLVSISTIYRNDGNNTFTAAVSLLGLLSGSAAWGDYDNDGDLDILQTGLSLGVGVSRVYRNDGNNTFAVGVTLTGLLMSSVAWGDHDNDGDLDILIAGNTGLNPLTILYNNTTLTANTAPTAPSNLQALVTNGTSATLSWSRASDIETGQSGLSYAVSVGTTTGGVQIKSGHAHLGTGFRRVPEIGNVGETTATFLTGLIPGQTYYWRVQSIDAGMRGSTLASGSFVTPVTSATQLVISTMSSMTLPSGSSVTMTIEVQNSYGQTVSVTQATTIGVLFSNPYLTLGSGSTEAIVAAGDSGTTLTLTLNSTSSASVTAILNVSSPGLSTTSQSVTITPSSLYIASHLVVTSITPTIPGSGDPFVVTVESQNSFGEVVAVTQATMVEISFNNPYLTLGSGNTEAIVAAGDSGTTLTLTLNSTSSASVTAILNISSPSLSATSQSMTITPVLSFVVSQLAITSITPSTPGSGELFAVIIESRNDFGETVPVTQATAIGVVFDNPYLTLGSGGTQATLQSGQSSVSIMMKLDNSSTSSVEVPISVIAANLAATSQSITIGGNKSPFISMVADVVADEDSLVSSTFMISDTETPLSQLVVTATSDNILLLPNTNIVISSTAATMTLLLSPAPNQSGIATITLTVSDGLVNSSTTFTLTVLPVNDPPLAFDDIDTVCANSSSLIQPLLNDIDIDGDTMMVVSITQGSSGTVQIVNPTSLVYTPDRDYSGNDSFSYTMSDSRGELATAIVHITVREPILASAGADTSILAGSSAQLQATGGVSYSWLPTAGLSDPSIARPIASPMQTTSYIVTVTGSNGCETRDTVIVSVQGRDMHITVLLEGAYEPAAGVMSAALYMQNLLPLEQPYSMEPFSYNGSENAQELPDSVVDWVLIELRSMQNASSVVTQRAVLLRTDGTLADTQGITPTIPDSIPSGNYYVVVYHRNHLPVMSASAVTLTAEGMTYDFTSSLGQAHRDFYDPMIQITSGVYGMVSGDANRDGIINAVDRVDVRNNSGNTGYLLSDITLDGIINAADRVLVRNNKFFVYQVPE